MAAVTDVVADKASATPSPADGQAGLEARLATLFIEASRAHQLLIAQRLMTSGKIPAHVIGNEALWHWMSKGGPAQGAPKQAPLAHDAPGDAQSAPQDPTGDTARARCKGCRLRFAGPLLNHLAKYDPAELVPANPSADWQALIHAWLHPPPVQRRVTLVQMRGPGDGKPEVTPDAPPHP